MRRNLLCSLFAAAWLCAVSLTQATMIEIQLVDVDVQYDSSTGLITDTGAPRDPLTGIFVFAGGALQGSLTSSNLSFDLSIPGVFGIDPSGDTVTSAAGGSLSIFTPGLILDLTLDTADVIYNPFGGSFDFVFVGTVGSINAQNLPFVPGIGGAVSVTLSTQADTLIANATEVTSFTASGTGELEADLDLDPDNVVPEPATLALLAATLAAVAVRRRD
ncbi:PEP-CTERM sorting domain-containing protein [Botrimarina hoheduenensis]|uniref:Ice-binding protein C-terminal domain-containing protein n=1 Tax=Botrimarina hoheduenensis TaxID=2528000 RepID=A0A5C5VTT6_9BACT|nr:PEP-CTERM sorting domain-containing protein [Botrimarina hoheduenensis]TWT41543.1 hypothetical protein Pla111_29200 [Botrimarina hoheduenensis]